MFSFFMREKPCALLLALKNTETIWHLSKLAKSTSTTYVFVTHAISELEKQGLVKTEIKGKKRIVKLSERGTIIAAQLEELKNKLEQKS